MSREFIIQRNRTGHLFSISLDGGGRMPVELLGDYTNEHSARRAIDLYLDKKSNAKSRDKQEV